MSHFDSTTTVGQLVTERPDRGRIFERYRIDYCCGGKKSLRDACAATGADLEAVVDALEAHDRTYGATGAIDWSRAPTLELVDHIEAVHHGFLKQELPRVAFLVDKVADVHGGRHPELVEVRRVFHDLKLEMETHMMKEEQVLFPMIRQLARGAADSFHCGSIRNPIRQMELEHDDAGAALSRLRTLTGDYQPPADACGSYRVMLEGLRGIEEDLHLHVHKENNILFPKVTGSAQAEG
jgi:regulator of cell morphogenesis and NO signaling